MGNWLIGLPGQQLLTQRVDENVCINAASLQLLMISVLTGLTYFMQSHTALG